MFFSKNSSTQLPQVKENLSNSQWIEKVKIQPFNKQSSSQRSTQIINNQSEVLKKWNENMPSTELQQIPSEIQQLERQKQMIQKYAQYRQRKQLREGSLQEPLNTNNNFTQQSSNQESIEDNQSQNSKQYVRQRQQKQNSMSNLSNIFSNQKKMKQLFTVGDINSNNNTPKSQQTSQLFVNINNTESQQYLVPKPIVQKRSRTRLAQLEPMSSNTSSNNSIESLSHISSNILSSPGQNVNSVQFSRKNLSHFSSKKNTDVLSPLINQYESLGSIEQDSDKDNNNKNNEVENKQVKQIKSCLKQKLTYIDNQQDKQQKSLVDKIIPNLRISKSKRDIRVSFKNKINIYSQEGQQKSEFLKFNF